MEELSTDINSNTRLHFEPETEEIAKPAILTGAAGASDSDRGGYVQYSRRWMVFFLALLLSSLPLRLVHLQEPLLGQQEFRQTQTAMSVWDIREHGVSWLHPKLPLFGPPWECPLEYPVFQLIAAGVDCIVPWHNLDASIRLTSLMFFYLSAVALYLVARQLFERPTVALFTAAIFLFAPYNFYWSRAATIEYAAGFFALSYLLCFIRWTLKPGWTLFVLTLLFGTLGTLTKITTFAGPLFVVSILSALHVWEVPRAKIGFWRESGGSIPAEAPPGALRPAQIVLLACLLMLPLTVGCLYVRFSDQIKAQSPYTAWLCSNCPFIKHWIYGTLRERFSHLTWNVVLERIRDVVQSTPAIILIAGLLVLPFKTRAFQTLRYGNFWVGLGLALAPFAVVLVFFKLYVIHTYYYIAITPLLALAAGLGMDFVFSLASRRYLKSLLLLGFLGLWTRDLSREAAAMLAPQSPDRRLIYLTQAANKIPKDDPVIVVSQWEWSSFTPYYLKHRAFMALLINKPVDPRPLVETDYLKQNGFHWLLVDGKTPEVQALTTGITNRWKFARLVPGPNKAYKLYSLSDQ